MLRRTLIYLSAFLFSAAAEAQSSGQETRRHYQDKIKRYLQKDAGISKYFSLTDKAFIMYASPSNKIRQVPEVVIPWKDAAAFGSFLNENNKATTLDVYNHARAGSLTYAVDGTDAEAGIYNPQQPLAGYRIAIDPGHVAGNAVTAAIEMKALTLYADSSEEVTEDISLIEGNLNLTSGLLLQEQLENAGAEVMLTRHAPNVSAFGITYDEWLKTHFKSTVDNEFRSGRISASEKNFLLHKATKKQIFHQLFKNLDLEERICKINEYNPDVTVIIHYNVDEKNADWVRPTAKNFTMAFVGGAFMAHELKSRKARFEFVRMLFSDDVDNSIALSKAVVQQFEQQLNIPAARPADAEYLSKNSLQAEKGVYCRNLLMAKYIKGPLVYGESLYQDNLEEAKALAAIKGRISELSFSGRVEEVAGAYFKGIINYAAAKAGYVDVAGTPTPGPHQ